MLERSDGDPFLGLTIADRFVVTSKLGAGSMGTVYRARQEAVGRDVALKILRSDRALDAMAKARFGREARALSLLSSLHTVTVFDFGEVRDPAADELAPTESSLFLAMELLEGESLGDRLRRSQRLSSDEAIRVARQVLLSLSEAHEKGVIHRDLKPDNIFLARFGGGGASMGMTLAGEVVKVLDFGIAKVASASARGSSVSGVDALETQAGTVFGTPRYMSPEQAQGKELDVRSDLYTLGVLLYHMVVGRAPFVDDDAVVVMARHIKTPPVPPPDAAPDAEIPAELSALILRALAKDPDDRPQSARAFLADLDAVTVSATHARALGPTETKSGRTALADMASVATGELSAFVHDGRAQASVDSRARRRSLGLGFFVAIAVLAPTLLFVLGAGRGGAPVASAHAEIGHQVMVRRLAMLRAALPKVAPVATAASAAPNASSAAASAGVEGDLSALAASGSLSGSVSSVSSGVPALLALPTGAIEAAPAPMGAVQSAPPGSFPMRRVRHYRKFEP